MWRCTVLQGIKKESEIAPDESITAHTAKKLNVAVIVLLVAAMGMFAADRFLGHRAPATPTAHITPAAPVPEAAPVVSRPLTLETENEPGA